MIQSITDSEFELIKKLTTEVLGFDLADSKRSLVVSRLSGRISELKLTTIMDYLYYIRDNANGQDELVNLIDKITTNETSFFREQHHFDFLTNTLFPYFEQRRQKSGISTIRIWSAGCSSGEEPYTIAMVVKDFFKSAIGWDIKILATDISTKVLKKAEDGFYNRARTEEQVDPVMFSKYFSIIDENKVQVKEILKDIIQFKRLNFMDDTFPIKSQLDIIFCRNVMIYFGRDKKKEVISKFASYLAKGSYLIVGHSENLFSLSDEFEIASKTIYRKK